MAIANVTAGRRLRASEVNAIIAKVNALATPPQFQVRRVATQNITSGGAAQTITFDTETVDTDAMFSASSDTITIKTAGVWTFVGGGRIPGASGLKVWEITKNGTVQRDGATTGPDTLAQDGRTNVVLTFTCAVNDVIKLQAFQNSGGTVAATAWFSGSKVSD